MYQDSRLKLKNNQEEIVPFDEDDFPYISHDCHVDDFPNQSVPWHWHQEMELFYIREGVLEYHTLEQTYFMKKGDAGFVNTNVIHMTKPKDGMRGCVNNAQLFDMHFLSGQYGSRFEKNYLLPVANCLDIRIYPIYPDSKEGIYLIARILEAIEYYEKKPFGYEFEIRNCLSGFWYHFFEDTAEIRKNSHRKSDASMERCRLMISYIMEHFAEKVELKDIAEAANISQRECSRCFQKNFGTSPVEYLNEHRIRMASKMLAQGADSITDISENCGFSSVSYFGKLFREIMKCTPREYRRKIENG